MLKVVLWIVGPKNVHEQLSINSQGYMLHEVLQVQC